MSRAGFLILLGVLVFLAPFSGFPTGIRSLFEVIFGAFVFGIGIALRAKEMKGAHIAETKVTTNAISMEGMPSESFSVSHATSESPASRKIVN